MKYPTLGLSQTHALTELFLESGPGPIDSEVGWIGRDDSYDVSTTFVSEQLASNESVEEMLKAGLGKDQVEGVIAVQLYSDLGGVPVEILDDAGFWRFLALARFWEFVAWRESKPFADGNVEIYVDARNSRESVLLRMFIRGRLMVESDSSELASELAGAVDFWRSHVIRVKTGNAPLLSSEFARRQRTLRMKTPELRKFAKRLNRLWLNVELATYHKDSSERLIASLADDL